MMMASREGRPNRKTIAKGRLAEALQQLSPEHPGLPPRRGARLSYADIALAVQLEAAGKQQKEIAAVLHCSQPHVARILQHFRDTRPVAKARLNHAAEHLATAAVTAASVAAAAGDAEPALELLDRIQVAPKTREAAAEAPKIMIVVGQPTPDALPPALSALPTISVSSPRSL